MFWMMRRSSAGSESAEEAGATPAARGAVKGSRFGLVVMTPWDSFCHFCLTVVKAFIANRCPVRASALAYSNLLALVPVLAVAISVTSGLLKQEGQERIESFIQQFAASVIPESKTVFGQLEDDPRILAARKEIAGRIQEFIQNTRSGALGATGMVALLVVGIGMLVRIENTFNDIWSISIGRTWFSRVVLYWAALTLGPLLLVAAIALTGSVHLDATKAYLGSLPLGVGDTIAFSFSCLPFLILIVTFAGFYKLVPHTHVSWSAAFVGGVVGGTLWQLNNLVSVFYASRVVTNSHIYGSLGLVPVVMIGLYLSWLILLFGAQVAYIFQNRRACFQERQMAQFNHASREWVAFQTMIRCARAFRDRQNPPSIESLAAELALPTGVLAQVSQSLMDAVLLAEVTQPQTGFVPARPLADISAYDILCALRCDGGEDPVLGLNEGVPSSLRDGLCAIRHAEGRVARELSLAVLAEGS